jgi:excisionase family DNA binding protein
MKSEDRLLYRISEAAEVLGISRVKCYELANRGVIPTVRLGGGSIRVPVQGLRQMIERQLEQQQAAAV